MTFFVRLTTFVLPFLLLLLLLLLFPKIARSSELLTVGDGYIPLFIEVCKLYKTKSIIFLFAKSITEMEMTTTVFKWTRALSREGFTTSNLYFSELGKSYYYVRRILRPHYVAVISDYKGFNEFSLATSTFNMSFAAWLVIFIYKENVLDYCHNPPGNVFHLRFNSEMLVRCDKENILRDWYSIDPNRTEIDDIAIWSSEKGIIRMISDSLHDRRYNLQGLIMRAVMVKDSPFVKVNENGDLDGMFGRILRELCTTLNFSLNVVSEVEEYGIWNPKKNTWSGAIGELYNGRADISISDFSITSARFNAVDFTFPLLLSKSYLYIQKPQIFAFKWTTYFLAFSNSVWIAMFGVSVCATTLLLVLLIKYESNRNVGQLLSDNILEIWGIFCQQGLAEFPDRSSLRIVYFSVFILAVVLNAAYSAALISFIASGTTVLPFHSLEDFVADGSYKLVVVRGSSDYDIFANSEHSFAKKLMRLMLEHEQLPLTVLEGFKRICKNQKLAIYAPDEVERSEFNKIPCNLVSIETGTVDSLGMILSKHNQFTDVINFHLQKFINNGMMDRLKDMTFRMESDDEIYHQPVRITSVISLIIFILIGIFLSTCILIIEKYHFACKRKKETALDLIPLKKSSIHYIGIKYKRGIKNIAKSHKNRKFARIKY